MIQKIQEATQYIQKQCSLKPNTGIILGTGLGALVDEMEVEKTINYEDIPHFPVSTVEFHSGKLIFGKLAGKDVVTMQGRFHYYEGYSMQEVTFPVRVMKMLGIERLFVSNAAGGLNPNYQLSDLMIVDDHIDLLPDNPLRGKNVEEQGVRFPDMSEPYDREMIEEAKNIAAEHHIRTQQGIYAAVQGPNLETRAEYKYLNMIGADAVGMSTVPENIVANQMGLPCFAVSVITDLCSPGNIKPVVIEEVIEAANKAQPGMTVIIKELVKRHG